MVINIWRYDSTLKGVASPKLKQEFAFSTSLSRARYIFDIQLSAEDVAIMEQVRPVGDYVDRDSAQGHRIEGRHAYNMVSQDPEGRSQEIAIYGARAGLNRFWHIAVSSREGEHLTPEQLEHVRSVVCRVMGIEDCPSVWADHRDTDNDHMHGLVVSFLADEDRPVTFGQEWWKEAGQIAMAIIERDLDLEPEPNRRYVADRTGVYHTFSDIKVADENGTILGRSEIVAAQKAHKVWKRDNYAAQIENSGAEWDLERAVQVLAKPRIMKSDNATEVHESLARVGLKYIAGQSGARIVANGYLPGSGKDAQGQSIAAGKAYSNAALKKLGNRLKGGFKPAPPDLSVRTFVMPRFEKLTEEERDRYADRRAENEECKALTQHLDKHNAHHYRRMRDTEKGASTNERRAQRRRSHEEEMSEAKALETSLSKPFREARVFPEEKDDTLAILWGPPAGRSSPHKAQREADERRELEDRYRVEDAGHTRNYWHGNELAFVERLRTIRIVSQKRRVRIDALKLARRRFKHLRVASAQKVRKGLARIAAELGIYLEKGLLKKIGHAHAIALEAGAIRSIVAACRAYHDTLDERAAYRSAAMRAGQSRAERIREYGKPDHPMRIETLVTDHVRELQNASLDPNAPDPSREARRRLVQDIDHNTLHLASSRYQATFAGRRYGFLDDPVLLRAFEDAPHRLVDPAVQRDLAAIEAVQLERRRWIAAAIVSGAASIEEDDLVVTGQNGSWAPAFWRAQRCDPTFRRLIAVARARPDRFVFDAEAKPGEQAIESAQAVHDHRFAAAIAKEMQYGSPPEKRRENLSVPQEPAVPGSGRVLDSEHARPSKERAAVQDKTGTQPSRSPYPLNPGGQGVER